MGWLFDSVHSHFSGEDYVSWVHLNFANPDVVASAYSWLRDKATGLVDENTFVWSKRESREIPVDSVPNAAELVVRGEGDAFCVWLRGIVSAGVALPDLGFFVFPEQIEVNWQGGSEWGEAEVEAFFTLLSELASRDTQATLVMPEGAVDEYAQSFMRAWSRFLGEHAA